MIMGVEYVFGMRWSWPISKHHLGIHLERLRETTKNHNQDGC